MTDSYSAGAPPDETRTPATGGCGMAVLLLALGMLFAASLAFFILMRVRAPSWPPPDAPHLPALFWLSTGLLITSSLTMQAAVISVRAGQLPALRSYLAATFVLGLLFLANQALCWLPLIRVSVTAQTNLFMLAFLMLAVLHGLHVIGGLIPLGLALSGVSGGGNDASRQAAVTHLATYWHFLDAVWLTIFITLLVAL